MLYARYVAGFRLAMAVIFMVAAWADPAQPVRNPEIGYGLLIAYLLWSTALVRIALRDWWIEFKAARPAIFIDVIMGVCAVYFTEGATQDFGTPVAAFLIFILVASTFVGDWRTGLFTGATFTFGVLLVAIWLASRGVDIDPVRIGRRVSFLLIITALVVWFAGRRTAPVVPNLLTVPKPGQSVPATEVLTYAMNMFRASRGVIAWAFKNGDEAQLQSQGYGTELNWRLPASQMSAFYAEGRPPLLFRTSSKVGITLDANGRTVACRESFESLQAFGCDEGLVLTFRATGCEGFVLLGGLAHMSRDLLPIGAECVREIGAACDRHSLSAQSFEQSISQIRNAVARDLHDSVAQSLAGASFQVEAARKAVISGRNPEEELNKVRDALQSEQRYVRTIIDRLRSGSKIRQRHDLADDLAALLPEIAGQWRLKTRLQRPAEAIEVGTGQLHDLRQIAREAVANAARHGAAGEVHFALVAEAQVFHLDIVDDGHGGKAGSAHPFEPRSIAERVAALGGKLDARRGPGGTRLYITVPRLSA